MINEPCVNEVSFDTYMLLVSIIAIISTTKLLSCPPLIANTVATITNKRIRRIAQISHAVNFTFSYSL